MKMILPNTFIIGVQKAGTTSMHNWLAQHPSVFAPEEFKDVDYVADPEKARHAAEYLKRDYAGHAGQKIILQTNVNYILYEDALDRIKKLSPGAKLIVILRDPVARAISAYRYFRKLGNESRSLEDALLYEPRSNLKYSKRNNDISYLEHGMYGEQLERVYQKFAPENILVLQFEELKEDPEGLIKRSFSFLEVDPGFRPVFYKKNRTGSIHLQWLHGMLTNTSRVRKVLVKYLLDWWLPMHRRQLIRRKLIDMNTGKKGEDPISNDLRVRLQDIFTEDQKKLEAMMRLYD